MPWPSCHMTLIQRAAAATEHEQMAVVGIAPQRLLHQQRQPVEDLAHVGVAARQPGGRRGRARQCRAVAAWVEWVEWVEWTTDRAIYQSRHLSLKRKKARAYPGLLGFRSSPNGRDRPPSSDPRYPRRAVQDGDWRGSAPRRHGRWRRVLSRPSRCGRHDAPFWLLPYAKLARRGSEGPARSGGRIAEGLASRPERRSGGVR
jgi:hypothetical protein